jgi:hypothetical protein
VEVLAVQERSTPCGGGGVPLPVRDWSAGEFEELPAKEALAEAVPLAWGAKITVNDAFCPAARVNGNESPLRTNSEVLGVPEKMVTLEPVALSVAVMLLLVPTTTLPKSKVAGLIPNWPAAVPVPNREIVRFELEAFERTEMLPLALVEELGAKVTPKVKLCPGIRDSGRLKPLTLNPAPVALAWAMVTLEPPELVKLSDSVWLLPTWTLPKVRLLAVAASDPGVTPEPESGTVTVGFDALLVMERLPLADPPDDGVNVTLRVAL